MDPKETSTSSRISGQDIKPKKKFREVNHFTNLLMSSFLRVSSKQTSSFKYIKG